MGKRKKDENAQILRVLYLYERLCHGEVINKAKEAERTEVVPRTIQRDFKAINDYLGYKSAKNSEVVYDKAKDVYRMKHKDDYWLTREEALAATKILLESRALLKPQIESLLEKIGRFCDPSDKKLLNEIIANEVDHYHELQHRKDLLPILWNLCEAKQSNRKIEISYRKEFDDQAGIRRLCPLGIIFAEFYFYLIAYKDDSDLGNDRFPVVYRIDRIESCRILDETFQIEYSKRFEEGQMRERTQFMQAGELMTVRFKFWGDSHQAMLDRLPTAKLIKQEGKVAHFVAEVYGRGIKMWLLSQGQYLEVTGPQDFRDEMKRTIAEMAKVYN